MNAFSIGVNVCMHLIKANQIDPINHDIVEINTGTEKTWSYAIKDMGGGRCRLYLIVEDEVNRDVCVDCDRNDQDNGGNCEDI